MERLMSDVRPWIVLIVLATTLNAIVVLQSADILAYVLGVTNVAILAVFGMEGVVAWFEDL